RYTLSLIVIAIATGCTDPNAKYAAGIRSVFTQNASLVEKRKAAEEGNVTAAVKDYANGLSRIDLTHCPPDFQKAFIAYQNTWIESIPLFEKYDSITGKIMILVEGPNVTEKQLLTLQRAILDKWGECELVALRYGVKAKE